MTQQDNSFKQQHNEGMKKAISTREDDSQIRKECLIPYIRGWLQPDGGEVREILRKANLSGGEAAKLIGIADSRTVRRWTSDESPIPYAAWAILCHAAGYGEIWIERQA